MKIIFIISSIIIVLLGLELALKLSSSIGVSGLIIDDKLGWRFRPDYSWTNINGKKVSFNSMGFRDKNRSYLKQPGIKRVLVLGDSYAAGANVGDNETFSSHLESSLNENAKFEVINISVAAWSTDQQLLYLYEQINKWKPDYIILTIAPNDIRESFSKQIVKIENEKIITKEYNFSYMEKLFWKLSLHSYLFQYIQKKIIGLSYGDFKFLFKRIPMTFPIEGNVYCDDRRVFYPEKSLIVNNAYQYFDTLILYMNRLSKKSNAKLLLTVIPTLVEFQKENEKYPDFQGKVSRHVLNLAQLNNIEFIDIISSFKKSNNPQYFFLSDDYHLNPQGHKRVADLLKEYFEVKGY